VAQAIQQILQDGSLRKYPDPLGTYFREIAGKVFGIDPDSILIGNGSDDILTILTRAFVPQGGLIVSPTPSYLLYQTLAEIQGARFQSVPFTSEWRLPKPWPVPRAHLTFIPNPNSPSGTFIPVEELAELAKTLSGPLVIDEAYVDFAPAHALRLSRSANVIITRSLSKSYSLAGLRFGFAVACPEIIREFIKIKDSYNCDTLSLAGAAAAVQDQDYLQSTRSKICNTRERLEMELKKLGFEVCPSQANLVWCRRPGGSLKQIFQELKNRKILVRYMDYPNYGDGLRISVGTDPEIDRLILELKKII
jgi:histidinol-phosphate aminotransferase